MMLDLVIFEEELYKASCKALEAIKKDCQTERLYAFALVTTGLFGYIFPYANTEEGILAGAKRDLVHFQDKLEFALKCNTWEPSPTWRFFKTHDHHFERINNLLDKVHIQDALCKLPETEFDAAITTLEDVLFSVLNKLRKEGHFGKDPDKFYANISYQDQTFEDLHRCALRVNSIEVCTSMWNDLSDVLGFWNSNGQEAG